MQVEFPPNVPEKLIALYRKLGGKRAVARACGVNIAHVVRLMQTGREPQDPDIRKRLFLSRKPKAARQPKPKARPMWLDDLRQFEIETR